MSLSAGSRLGRYEVVSVVDDAGGRGVYLAHDTHLRRDVAIKILPAGLSDDPIRRARFDHDTHTIAQLSHPGICAVFDVGEQDGMAFLVMERVDGESLEARLRTGPLPWRAALGIAVQIADALGAAHKLGIVHRDLTPENVVILGTTVKLLDFGLAALIGPSDGNAASPGASPTAEHQTTGKLNYASPEQLEGHVVDARTDIFALGAVLYEMLAGRKAFEGESAASVTMAVMTATPPPISVSAIGGGAAPPSLNHVVQRALAKRPGDRWQTARDFRNEIQWMLDSSIRKAASGLAVRRRLVVLALAGTLLLAAGAVIGRLAWLAADTAQPLRLVTFAINPPEGTRLSAIDAIAVSPDGRKVAFVASENGQPSLWVRDLGKTESSRIKDTDGAENPFWSSYGQSIGFFLDAGRRIKRVDVSGRSSQPVAEMPMAPPAASATACWMPDGNIIFSLGSGLYRVPASGGKPVPIAVPDQSRGDWATLLPSALGNDLFFYLARNEVTHNLEGRIAGMVSPPKSLPSIQSNVVHAGGHLIFRDGAALVAQPFVDRSATLASRPKVLASGVDYDPVDGHIVFSASSSVLAYRAPVARQLTWVDRSGHPMGSPIGEERDWDPVIASDGSETVAFDRFTGTSSSQIWTINGQGQRMPLSPGSADSAPVWSPDGKSLAYVRTTERGSAIYRSAVEGKSAGELLLETPGRAVPIDWSRDGRLLYNLDHDVWAYSFDTKKSENLTSLGTVDRAARLSRDGRWLAYSVGSGAEAGLWVKSLPEGVPQRVVAGDGFDPAWRDDGQELYYMTHAGQLMAVTAGGEAVPAFATPRELFAMDPTGIRTPLHVFAATPNGQQFLVSEPAHREPGITVVVNWQSLVR